MGTNQLEHHNSISCKQISSESESGHINLEKDQKKSIFADMLLLFYAGITKRQEVIAAYHIQNAGVVIVQQHFSFHCFFLILESYL